MSDTLTRRLDLGAVLTAANGERYIVVDIIGTKLKLCRIPDGFEPENFGTRFWHDATPDDPTRPSIER